MNENLEEVVSGGLEGDEWAAVSWDGIREGSGIRREVTGVFRGMRNWDPMVATCLFEYR